MPIAIATDITAIFPAASDIPSAIRVEPPVDQVEYLVNGELRRWGGACRDVFSPVCVQTPQGPRRVRLGRYPQLDEAAALSALEAAVKAYDNGRAAWPTLPVAGRIRHVEDFVFRMQARKKEVVNLLMWEIGKSCADAEKEFDRTILYVKDTIDALKDMDRVSSRFMIEQGIIGQIRRAPLGVALCMGPFNYPLNETFTTLIPALIMGNTVVFKPAKMGVLLHRPLLEAYRDAFPPGVINVVYGEGRKITPPLMASGQVSVLAFIGTSRAADSLKQAHPAPHRLRCVLGLDAKNAGIVCPTPIFRSLFRSASWARSRTTASVARRSRSFRSARRGGRVCRAVLRRPGKAQSGHAVGGGRRPDAAAGRAVQPRDARAAAADDRGLRHADEPRARHRAPHRAPRAEPGAGPGRRRRPRVRRRRGRRGGARRRPGLSVGRRPRTRRRDRTPSDRRAPRGPRRPGDRAPQQVTAHPNRSPRTPSVGCAVVTRGVRSGLAAAGGCGVATRRGRCRGSRPPRGSGRGKSPPPEPEPLEQPDRGGVGRIGVRLDTVEVKRVEAVSSAGSTVRRPGRSRRGPRRRRGARRAARNRAR